MGAFGAIEALAALGWLFVVEARAEGLRPASARLFYFAWRLVPALLLAYAVMALVWPWSVIDPLNPFRAVEYFSHFFEKPWHELFGGELISVPDMPRSYAPTLFALELPEIFLVLGLAGAAGALVAATRRDVMPNRRAILLSVALMMTSRASAIRDRHESSATRMCSRQRAPPNGPREVAMIATGL